MKIVKVRKRDDRIKDFSFDRIREAIKLAYLDYYKNIEKFNKDISSLTELIYNKLDKVNNSIIDIESIQDIVIDSLNRIDNNVSKAYEDYRKKREYARKHPIDKQIMSLLKNKNDFLAKENANKRPELASTQRDLMAGTVSRHLARQMIPTEIMRAHDLGIIKHHDLDYYVNSISNCELLNLEDMLQNGTVINGKMIKKPHSIQTAMTIATQIVVQVTSNTYGGCTISLSHLAPFVRISKEKIKKNIIRQHELIKKPLTDEEYEILTKDELKVHAIPDSVQTFNYQINTMSGTNGQSPFLTVFIYLNEDKEYTEEIAMLAEEFFKQRIKGIEDEHGVCTTQTFPKLVYVLDENNIYPQSKYFWLTQLAMKSTAKRQSPDYQSARVMKEIYGDVFPEMGCRSFLFPYKPDGEHFKWYGRGNLGVTTINLPDIALSSKKDENVFWQIFEDRMENLIKPACLLRYEKLKGTKASIAPILWQYGGFARLKSDEPITKAIDKNKFSLSIGYVGIYETVYYMTGESNTSEKGKAFALKVLKALEEKADKWKEETGLGFSIYGTPQEESTDFFCNCLKKRFGIVEGVTDHGYITNSYHVNPHEEIDAFTKLELEGEFQRYSKGGNVSYIETAGLEDNLDAMYEILKCIYENNTHAEINSQSDCVCYKCGYKGKFENEGDGDYKWICPNCGNDNQEEMSIVLRVCGYLSNKGKYVKGRMKDILARVIHI